MITHEVENQPPPLVGYNAAEVPVIREALVRAGAAHALGELDEVGRLAGSAHAIGLGDRAEANEPILRSHDRYGHRIDEVEYDPAYHELMATAIGHGIAAAPWASADPNAHLIRAAKYVTWQIVDAGHACPVTMTYASVPALRVDPALARQYEPLLTSRDYDPTLRVPTHKPGITAGMSMTEKQGGSDVRTNSTRAEPLADGTYRIVGHKWFTSAPMSDLLLTLAVAPEGVTCFVLPRVLPDGSRNAIRLQRLKDKLGNRSNASSELEYEDAIGWRLGDEGRGVRTIIEMVNATRLDCTLGTASLMRHGVHQAVHHVRHRVAFGERLVDQPLMRNVVADLALEAEASTTVALWLASLVDAGLAGDEEAGLLRRIGVAISKYYVCKRGPGHAAEALECLGGNGYVEDSRMPRMYREAPINSVWEGSGNVAALDTLRAMERQPEAVEALLRLLRGATGADARYDAYLDGIGRELADRSDLEFRARRVVGRLAVALQAALLLERGHPAFADAFVASRLGGDWGSVYGTLGPGADLDAIIGRYVVASMPA